ncbi:hypothetical protein F66182_9999 [Fusarium sp. NRRL 66182]|nr:hypothetical protein F66182_9999 [Fusarium sp. NRRL 66182]
MSLDNLPPIFLLSTHLKSDEQHRLEEQIPTLTHDIKEAEIVVGKISQQRRAEFELRRAKLDFVPFEQSHARQDELLSANLAQNSEDGPKSKRRRITKESVTTTNTVQVVKLAWLQDSWAKGRVLSVEEYVVYECSKVLPRETTPTAVSHKNPASSTSPASSVPERTTLEQKAQPVNSSPRKHHKRHHDTSTTLSHQHAPSLLHQSTSEHDIVLPDVPDFLGTTYSCQRPTPIDPPNGTFAKALIEVRTIRQLRGDGIGASFILLTQGGSQLNLLSEVARLPGCGDRIAKLWSQYRETGQLDEVREANADPMIAVLKIFFNIWGVGAVTAREIYAKGECPEDTTTGPTMTPIDAGWRDLDDLVEFGWNTLTRSQQIGVKYYNELLQGIPQDEVATISSTVLEHARKIDPGFEMVIVGGYRRGKQYSGDVDIVLSHRDESKTLRVISEIVASLEKGHLITHTLTLSTHNSERGQRPLLWKGEHSSRSGFDTLDKALVVWKDPGKQDAPHRRVDIIISPWKTAGCAILGGSGGTTFQRDVRRYCKNVKGFKFDSSGIRRRADGMWMDLEGSSTGDQASDMETAERRVFEGLGLPWRSPEERCTG